MTGAIHWTAEADLGISGTGGAGTYVESSIPTLHQSGLIRAAHFRLSKDSGTPDLVLFQRTGQADSAHTYRLLTQTPSGASTLVILDPPIPFENKDSTQTSNLYVVADNDGGAGDESTYQVSLGIEYSA